MCVCDVCDSVCVCMCVTEGVCDTCVKEGVCVCVRAQCQWNVCTSVCDVSGSASVCM